MKDAAVVRRGAAGDVEPSLGVWRAAEEARRGGRTASPEQGDRVRAHVENPEAFLFVAESGCEVVGMAVGMQGRAEDGAGPPIRGLCHVGAIFVRPDRWGGGVGGALVEAVLAEPDPGTTTGRSSGHTRTTPVPTGSTNAAASAAPAARRRTTSARPSHTTRARCKLPSNTARQQPVGAGFKPVRRSEARQTSRISIMRRHR